MLAASKPINMCDQEDNNKEYAEKIEGHSENHVLIKNILGIGYNIDLTLEIFNNKIKLIWKEKRQAMVSLKLDKLI